MIRVLLTALVVAFMASCETAPKAKSKRTSVDEVKEEVVTKMSEEVKSRYFEIGLIEVTDPRIIIDLRYTTDNNFMGHVLYDTIDGLFLQEEVVFRLSSCQDLLDSLCPGYRLKVFDGVRPLQVQRDMWESLDSIPVYRRGKFVSNPLYGSVHNFGTAVDITICDSLGNELDMGAGYDDFRPIAFPSKEAIFLKSGELSIDQWKNRKLLRKIMRSQKFYNIPSEWWHFNAFPRITCERKFEILLTESGSHEVWVSPPLPIDSSQITDSVIILLDTVPTLN